MPYFVPHAVQSWWRFPPLLYTWFLKEQVQEIWAGPDGRAAGNELHQMLSGPIRMRRDHTPRGSPRHQCTPCSHVHHLQPGWVAKISSGTSLVCVRRGLKRPQDNKETVSEPSRGGGGGRPMGSSWWQTPPSSALSLLDRLSWVGPSPFWLCQPTVHICMFGRWAWDTLLSFFTVFWCGCRLAVAR